MDTRLRWAGVHNNSFKYKDLPAPQRKHGASPYEVTTMTALRYISVDSVKYSLFWCCKWWRWIAGFAIRTNNTAICNISTASWQIHQTLHFSQCKCTASYIRLSVQTFNTGKSQIAVFEIISRSFTHMALAAAVLLHCTSSLNFHHFTTSTVQLIQHYQHVMQIVVW